jgi:hypothetical protein
MHDVVAPAAQRFTVDHKFPIELGFGLHGEPGFDKHGHRRQPAGA